MKKLKKLSLNQLRKVEIEKRELKGIKGGCIDCGCLYEGPQCPSSDDYYGGSSEWDNAWANWG